MGDSRRPRPARQVERRDRPHRYPPQQCCHYHHQARQGQVRFRYAATLVRFIELISRRAILDRKNRKKEAAGADVEMVDVSSLLAFTDYRILTSIPLFAVIFPRTCILPSSLVFALHLKISHA